MACKPFNRQRRHAGFTLIELLVAITVLAIVAVLGWRGLDGIVRARSTLTDDMEGTRGLQLAFAQLQSDCGHLARASDVPDRARLLLARNALVLVRSVFSDNQPSRIQVVAYRLTDGNLTRRESVATRDLIELDKMWQNTISDLDNSEAITLQSGVAAITMRTWTRGEPDWRSVDTQAVAASPTVTTGQNLPIGLEFALQLKDRPDRMLKIFFLGAV